MKLSEIVAELKALKDTVAGFIGDKAKATAEALTNFQTSLAALEATVTGQLTQLAADLATARQTIGTEQTKLEKAQNEANSFGGTLAAVTTQLNEAVTALKLDVPADAPPSDKIKAILGAVNAGLAKTGVDITTLPAAPAQTRAGKPGDAVPDFSAIRDPAKRTLAFREWRLKTTGTARMPKPTGR